MRASPRRWLGTRRIAVLLILAGIAAASGSCVDTVGVGVRVGAPPPYTGRYSSAVTIGGGPVSR